jgi:hypothetical protein
MMESSKPMNDPSSLTPGEQGHLSRLVGIIMTMLFIREKIRLFFKRINTLS